MLIAQLTQAHTHNMHAQNTHTYTYTYIHKHTMQEAGKWRREGVMNEHCMPDHPILNAGPKQYTVPSHHAGVRLHSTVTRVSVKL